MIARQIALAACLLLCSFQAFAEQNNVYDRIAFSVAAEKEVENDVLTAVLFASQSGQDAAMLSEAVNEAITWGMDIAKQEEAIESRTLGYTTNPVYKNGRVDGWQVRQSIELKSKDSKILSELLGQLQSKLQVQSVSYSISDEVRRATEETLISEALATFKNRASQIQSNMQRAEYRVVRLAIRTENHHPQPGFRMARAEAMVSSAPAAPPSLEGGKQKVRVSVDAEIELSVN